MRQHRSLWRSIGGQLAWVMFVIVAVLDTVASAAPPSTDELAGAAEARSIWDQFAKINEAWLNPHPKRLSYVATATPKRDDGTIGTYANRIWIDDDEARWEMESTPPGPVGAEKSTEIVIYSGQKVVYLLPSKADLLGRPVPIQMQLPLRQGIQWYTAAHSIRHEGLPPDAHIVDRKKAENSENVVLEMDFGQRRGSVGLGFFHVFLGQSNFRIGRVRMEIRLPEHLLRKEEFLDHQAAVQYDANYFELGGERAPRTMRYLSRIADDKQWVLEGRFQNLDGNWLLEEAFNLQDGKTVTQLKVSQASLAEIDPALFRSDGKATAPQ